MNNKKLSKLNRKELLEILLEQTKRIEELEEELVKVKDELSNKQCLLKEVGTLADASFVLSNIFKEADEVVKIYKRNVLEQLKLEYMENKKFLIDFRNNKITEIENLK